MNIRDIPTLRLLNQHIAGSSKLEPSEIVRHMGAMQAQDYYGSLWSLGLRTGSTQKDIVKATQDRKIIRTWPQRGTLHFVPAQDARWMVGLSAQRLLQGARRRREQLGLDDTTLQKSQEILSQTLASGKILSRPKMMEILEQAGISTQSGRGYHILWYLSQNGVTYIGPMDGKQQTIGLLDNGANHRKMLTRQQSIAELAKRYFISHGPATIHDFRWWTGLSAADANAGLEANKSILSSEIVEGKQYWISKDTLKQGGGAVGSFLLPGFDEFMLGYKDRSAALHPDYAQKIIPGSNGMFLSTIIIGGQVVGTWKRTIKKDHVLIKLSPFRSLSQSDMKSLQTPAEKYGRFLGLPAKLD